MGKEVRGVIVTRVKGQKYEMSITNIREMLDYPILGVVPEDKNIPMSLKDKDAVVHSYPRSKSSKAYKRIAAKISNFDYKEPSLFARVFSRK